MVESTVTVNNALGLHARAAALLVRTASGFRSHIKLFRLDTNILADAKSILSVLYLAAIPGTEIKISADGEDEREAVSAIQSLFADGFGEL